MVKFSLKARGRGRPSIESFVKPLLIEILNSSPNPMSVSMIVRAVRKRTRKKMSWHTVDKYLMELVREKKIHYKNMKPINVKYFWNKPIPW